MRIIRSNVLSSSDLVIDAVYEGGRLGNAADDPISKILEGVGNQGGFRAAGRGPDKKYVVLYTSGEDKDWPDSLDLSTGQFIYFGDNKIPGHQLHETPRGGNEILRRAFQFLHASPPVREMVPPFFIFKRYPTPVSSRSVQFKGLAVPGFAGLPSTVDLVAIWKTTEGQRFQNYRAIFSVLDAPVIARSWLHELAVGPSAGAVGSAPAAWQDWVQSGRARALASENTTLIRSTEEQRPDTPTKTAILREIFRHFERAPIAFEAFAARVFQMHDPRVIVDTITRGSVDGGRDAIGRYLLGLPDDPVYAEFSLEAKCYQPGFDGTPPNTVGVREVSRLISRIRHRQFGVLVTTSVVARQAYEEVREDRHPIIFFSGGDITDILVRNGFNTPELVTSLLHSEFSLTETT
ncbi:restriction endonuclease [Bradyrhizobium sp. HKCCYLRH1062]|uniref:restriction endonuclease n=1 Tax=unclassified Bradyrhizobium TaxID=2631580 RepID=UPI003EBB7CF0